MLDSPYRDKRVLKQALKILSAWGFLPGETKQSRQAAHLTLTFNTPLFDPIFLFLLLFFLPLFLLLFLLRVSLTLNTPQFEIRSPRGDHYFFFFFFSLCPLKVSFSCFFFLFSVGLAGCRASDVAIPATCQANRQGETCSHPSSSVTIITEEAALTLRHL